MPANRAVLIELDMSKLAHDVAHTRSAIDAALNRCVDVREHVESEPVAEPQPATLKRRRGRQPAQLAT